MVGIIMRHAIRFAFFTSLLLAGSLSQAARFPANDGVLFEAYYKVSKSGEHVGYYVMKHEYDAKKKQFLATTFMKIEGAEGVTETIKATATEEFKPVSWSYTAIGGGETRTVDAKVAGGKLTATVNANGKVEKVSTALKKNSISSLFLIYAILRSPQGLKAKSQFTYEAIAEELAAEKPGVVDIKDFEDVGGRKALRLENTFLETKSSNFVNEKGEILMTLSPTAKITVEMVGTPEAAFGKFKIPTALLKASFGEVPAGQKNSLGKGAGV